MPVAELSCVVCSGAQDFFLCVVLGFQYVAQWKIDIQLASVLIYVYKAGNEKWKLLVQFKFAW